MAMKKKTSKKPAKASKRQGNGKFTKGISGNPNGPQKGYKKLRTLLVEQKLEELGCDPIEGMVSLAQDENTDTSIRAKLYSELANYIFPKRKAIEHSGSLNSKNPEEMTDQELMGIVNGGS
jgi:hypothetical protein